VADMNGRVVLVTGATSGIGEATAVGLARLGAEVIVHGRTPAKLEATAAKVPGTVHTVCGDLGSLAGVVALADEVKERFAALHVLLNNAGVWETTRRESQDGIEWTLAVNHLAPFVLTRALLPLLEASAPSRVVNVASTAHRRGKLDLEDLELLSGWSHLRAYANSKLCNVLFTRELARRLEGTGVTTTCLHPGVVRSGLVGDSKGFFAGVWKLAQPLYLTEEQGAKTSIWAASDPSLASASGGYYARCAPSRATPAGRDDALAAALWERTEALVARTLG